MAVVGDLFLARHLHVLQLSACLLQAGGCGVVLDVPGAQVVEPLFQRCCCHLVELVHTDEEVFGEDLFGCLHLDDILFLCGNL